MPNVSCTVSVVSHGHGDLVLCFLRSLVFGSDAQQVCLTVVVTLNVFESKLISAFRDQSWPFELHLVVNEAPIGFGANHNQAFGLSCGDWFGVLNPDILFRKQAGELPRLIDFLNHAPSTVGLVAVQQKCPAGRIQDSMRKLMTPWGVVTRALQRRFGSSIISGTVQNIDCADWVNGACMFIRSDVYRTLGGFDERYFMYCEDADFCLRLQLSGFRMAQADIAVIHDAQRNTTRKPVHLWWHVSSLLRFWCSSAFWQYLLRKRRNIL